MRKLVGVLGVVALLISTTAPASAKSTPTVGAKVKVANGTLKFFAYEQPVSADGTGEDPADAGEEYAAADVEACSTATKKQQVTPFMFIAQLPDTTKATATVTVKQPAMHSALLAKGECVRGWVTFSVPQGTRPTQLLFGQLGRPTAKWKIPAA
jgi:hypothetical protein